MGTLVGDISELCNDDILASQRQRQLVDTYQHINAAVERVAIIHSLLIRSGVNTLQFDPDTVGKMAATGLVAAHFSGEEDTNDEEKKPKEEEGNGPDVPVKKEVLKEKGSNDEKEKKLKAEQEKAKKKSEGLVADVTMAVLAIACQGATLAQVTALKMALYVRTNHQVALREMSRVLASASRQPIITADQVCVCVCVWTKRVRVATSWGT